MEIFREYQFDIEQEKIPFDKAIEYVETLLEKYQMTYDHIVFLVEFNIYDRNYERNIAEKFQPIYNRIEKEFPELLPYYTVLDHNLLNFYAYRLVQSEEYQAEFMPFLTNLTDWKLPNQFLEKETLMRVLKQLCHTKIVETIHIGLHGINWNGERNTNYFYGWNGNRFLKRYISDMIIIEYGIGADFWSLVADINITEQGSKDMKDIAAIEQKLVQEFGVWYQREIKNAFSKASLQEQWEKESKLEERLDWLKGEMEQLELPYKMPIVLTYPPEVNIRKVWKKVFEKSDYQWIGKQEDETYHAVKRSRNGYQYDIEIDLGSKGWRRLDYTLIIRGHKFTCTPILMEKPTPAKTEDYEKYLENFKVQVEFVEKQMEDFLYNLFGSCPEWYFDK